MNAIAQWLKEKGKIVIPKTLDTQVFDENGKSLDRRLKTAKDEQVIQLPKVDPTMIISDLDYSTEEQLTGKRWTDGKPIYQKTFEGITQTISDIEELVSLTSFGFRDSGDRDVIPMPYGGGVRWVLTNDVFNLINGSGLNYTKIVTTVQYTKNSDTADSPVTAPIIKHNYSTEEQVVGTWIDGKPLYEVTFSGNELSIPNVDHLHIIQSMAHSSTYDNYDPIPMPSYGVRWMFSKTNQNLTLLDTTGFHDTYETTIQYTKTTDTATT